MQRSLVYRLDNQVSLLGTMYNMLNTFERMYDAMGANGCVLSDKYAITCCI